MTQTGVISLISAPKDILLSFIISGPSGFSVVFFIECYPRRYPTAPPLPSSRACRGISVLFHKQRCLDFRRRSRSYGGHVARHDTQKRSSQTAISVIPPPPHLSSR